MTDEPRSRTEALLARVAELEDALTTAGDRIPPETARGVQEALSGVRERLAIGVDHTVVALAGGTGSGKSSLLNAISGHDFADVGVRRPTTSQVTACVWAHDADPLLDWLGVARDRRIERESELDGDTQADLRGLVLLDLPDHDSVEAEHRAVVDDLLPHVDLLVWVVDPQKYADDVLHSRYLRPMVGQEGSMLVLLNQIDTVPVGGQANVLRDVGHLLREDGLTGVGVYAVSAVTGDGLPVVRDVLARAVAAVGVAEQRVAGELDEAAARLSAAVGPDEPDVAPAAEAAVTELVRAAGVPQAADAVREAVGAGVRTPVRLGPVQPQRADAAHAGWLAAIGAVLPQEWVTSVRGRIGDPTVIAGAADERLAAIRAPQTRPLGTVVLRVLAVLVGLVTLVGVGLTVGVVLDEGELTERARGFVLTAVLGVVVTVLLLVAARLVRRWVATRRARDIDRLARRALAAVVDEHLVRPTVEVLEEHRAVRDAVRTSSPGALHVDSSTT